MSSRRLVKSAATPVAGLLAIGMVAAVGPLVSGCAGRSSAQAENREVRLTKDAVAKYSPRFSPDGAWVAYAATTGRESGALAVYVIPRKGGEPRKISPDTLSAVPIGWTEDGAGLFCRGREGRSVYRLGLDGSIRALETGNTIARTAAISPDGRTSVMIKFNQDNRDVGIRRASGAFELLGATPAWEEEAILGPGTGEITVVSSPSYQAQTTTISVWSPKTRSYSALPLPEGMKLNPAWSGDGSRLAFSYRREGQTDLWLYDARKARSAPLTDDPEDSASPSWSPDGDWLAFCRSTRVSHIYVGHPKKEGRRQITEGPDYDFAPAASPDGRWVAFLRRFVGGEERGKTVLCVVPASGGSVQRIDLGGLTIPGKGEVWLAWSPDASQIAFQASEGAARMDIYRIGRDGSGLARVTLEPGDEIEPRWSPDGKFISYTRVGGGQTRVAVVPASGGLPRYLGPEGVVSEGGLVSPRSDRLVYATFRADGTSELWIAGLATPEKPKMLAKGKLINWPNNWTRDGKEIVVMRGQGTSWQIVAFSPDAGSEKSIGRTVMLPSGKDAFHEFSSGGAKYEEVCYPAGIVVADGQDRSDLYLIRARIPDKSTALYLGEGRFLCSGFVGLDCCY